MPQLSVKLSKSLKTRLEDYASDNEISQRGAVRFILNRELPEEVKDEAP